jgi:very-short-patch-repair endonuclease
MARLARRQHGVVGRRQLLAIGFSARTVDVRLERLQLHEIHRGVYVFGPRRISRKGRWMAAVLASGDRAVLSHRSAARFWCLLPPAAEWIDVTRPDRRVRRAGIVGHRAKLRKDEWLVEDRIPVTSVYRTIFDLAAATGKREMERAWHEAEVRQLTDRVSLPMLLERYPGRRGTRVLREVLGSGEPVGISRNEFEEAFLSLVDANVLPRPRMNADLSVRGRFIEVDALWEQERLAVELDSRSVHGTTKRFESDRRRDRILVAEGFRTMRVTWWQLRDEPDEIVADLKLTLG